jgi:hypothetical protein
MALAARQAGDKDIGRKAVVAGLFGAVDRRPACQADASAVGFDLPDGFRAAQGHGKGQFHDVAFLPCAFDGGEAFHRGGLHFPAVDPDRPARRVRVCVAVKIAGHEAAACPDLLRPARC